MSKAKIRNTVILFLAASVLIFLFNRSMYWLEPDGFSKRHILVILISVFGVLGLPPILGFLEPFAKYTERFFDGISEALVKLKNNAGKALLVAIAGAAGILASFLAEKYLIRGAETFNLCRFYYLSGLWLLLVALFCFRKVALEKIEALFVVCALIMGTAFILSAPRHIGLACDDETHYGRTVSLSSFFDHNKYAADGKMILDNGYLVYGYMDGEIDYEANLAYYREMNELYDSKVVNDPEITYQGTYSFYSVAYIAPAIMIIIGKGLHLSYDRIFMLGRFGGLFVYTLVIWLGMRKLKSGKILMAVFALIPTIFYQACNYSADGWVVGFITAGMAGFIGELQEPERKLTRGNALFMILCFVLGALPKAIYFSLMILLFFLPRSKYTDDRQRKRYFLAVAGGIALLLISFLPGFLFGSGEGDTRGEGEINAFLQAKHILMYPFRYAKVLITFLYEYLSLDTTRAYLTNLGYLGTGYHYVFPMAMLTALAFLDRPEEPKRMPLVKIAYFGIALFTVVLVATSMYVSFTAVDFYTILGCQYRYLLPVVFSTLYFIGIDGVRIRYRKNVLAIGGITLSVLLFMAIYLELYIFAL